MATAQRFGRVVSSVAALLLAMAVGGVVTASSARAEHIAGATYNGTHSAGGTVQFTVSADGSSVTSFSFTNLPADRCTFTSGSLTGGVPITNHAFSYTSSSAAFGGTFSGLQSATGTMRWAAPFIPCTSPTVTWTATTTSQPIADLSVTLSDSPDPVLAGETLTYAATVANAGPSSAPGVTLAATLPAGSTLVSATSSQGSCSQAAGAVSCALGAIAAGGSAKATIVVTPGQAGQARASANVTSGGRDPNSANDSASQETTVLPPCLVPNVKGKPLAAAKQAIARANCATGKIAQAYSKKVKKGRVVSQKPAPGTRLPNRAKVNLVVSRGPKPRR